MQVEKSGQSDRARALVGRASFAAFFARVVVDLFVLKRRKSMQKNLQPRQHVEEKKTKQRRLAYGEEFAQTLRHVVDFVDLQGDVVEIAFAGRFGLTVSASAKKKKRTAHIRE